MDSIAKWSKEKRSELFEESARRKGVRPAIIEKDFWVCWTLDKLFSDESIREMIMFKGGTSLSKVFGLIERFSEDIDLVLHWDEITDDNPHEKLSKKKQDIFNKETRKRVQEYLKITFVDEIQRVIGRICSATINSDDSNIIIVEYPTIFTDKYLRSQILLEIGAFASWIPNDDYTITPYAYDYFPNKFSKPKCELRAIKAERTFWEKVTILHSIAHLPNTKDLPKRYSRHYYDLWKMFKSPFKDKAVNDIELLKDVVDFKIKFYYSKWASYDLAKIGTLKLVPPGHVRKQLEDDYKAMQEMIFGDAPAFNEIITAMETLEQEINELKE